MSADTWLYSAMGLLLALLVVIIGIGIVRWYQERERQRHALYEQLQRRCHRIGEVVKGIPDRYIPLESKTWLVQYLLDTVSTLPKAYLDAELEKDFVEYNQLLGELKQGQQATLKDRISNEEQLERVEQALKALPSLLKAMIAHGLADKASARYQTELIRFRFALAHHDLLLKRARDALDNDKRARALEYYREALIEVEKVSSHTESEPVIEGLKNTIKQLEDQLFKRNSSE